MKQSYRILRIQLYLVFTLLDVFSLFIDFELVKFKPSIHLTYFGLLLFFTEIPQILSRNTGSRTKKQSFTVTVWCLKYRIPSIFYSNYRHPELKNAISRIPSNRTPPLIERGFLNDKMGKYEKMRYQLCFFQRKMKM